MDNLDKLNKMVELQNSINKKVHPEWSMQEFPWHRAIYVEASEMLSHYGYKWWFKKEPDIPQVKLELVDIYHFAISLLYELCGGNLTVMSYDLIPPQKLRTGSFEDCCDSLVAMAGQRVFSTSSFFGCMKAVDMDFDELYRLYIAKNVLNNFRQDYGYKSGNYIKIWDGKEDNEVLYDLAFKLDADSESYMEDLYKGLEEAYPSPEKQLTSEV